MYLYFVKVFVALFGRQPYPRAIEDHERCAGVGRRHSDGDGTQERQDAPMVNR
jgi:hypothetical protein